MIAPGLSTHSCARPNFFCHRLSFKGAPTLLLLPWLGVWITMGGRTRRPVGLVAVASVRNGGVLAVVRTVLVPVFPRPLALPTDNVSL
jgi:hypothetical protein